MSRLRRRVTGMSAIESTNAARSNKGSNDSSQMVAMTLISNATTDFSHRGRVLRLPGSCFIAQDSLFALEIRWSTR